ncbi:MAG TPA: hypothetical protein V6C72_18805 [Chroococcales cyanobacterium]
MYTGQMQRTKLLLGFLIPFIVVGSLGAFLLYQTGGKDLGGLTAFDPSSANSAGTALIIALLIWFVVPGAIAGAIGISVISKK